MESVSLIGLAMEHKLLGLVFRLDILNDYRFTGDTH